MPTYPGVDGRALPTPFGFSPTDAIAYILVAQVLTYLIIGFWGSLGLWRYRAARTIEARG